MLDARVIDLLNCTEQSQYRACLSRFSAALGFSSFDTLTVIDRPGTSPEFICVDNIADPSWKDIDLALAQRDPVMQHCKVSSYPIVWGSANYSAPECADIYELVSAYGLCSGISIASHLPDGRHFALCLHLDRDLPRWRAMAQEVLKQVESYVVYAMDAAFRIQLPPEQSNVGELSVRERDALRWMLEGLSLDELAQRLFLGERECRTWLYLVAEKLDSMDIRQAALKARRIGAI